MKRLFPGNKIQRMSAQDYAYLEVKQKILDGTLAPEAAIVEEDLSNQLDLSRTPLRGAIQLLEFENLLVRKSNGRLMVAPVSSKEAREIFNVRCKLEEIAVEEATKHATEEDLRKLSYIVSMIEESKDGGRVDDVLYYGDQFHSYIYDLSNNDTVINFLTQLKDHIHRYRRLVPKQTSRDMTMSGEDHGFILEKIKARDAIGAKKLMTNHIMKSLDYAIKAIELYKENEINT